MLPASGAPDRGTGAGLRTTTPGLAAQPLSTRGRDRGRADGGTAPGPAPAWSPSRARPRPLPGVGERLLPGAEKPVCPVGQSGGKRALPPRKGARTRGGGKAGSPWRATRAGGVAANWTGFPGPPASPCVPCSASATAAPGPGGRWPGAHQPWTSLGAPRTPRMPKPGPSEH